VRAARGEVDFVGADHDGQSNHFLVRQDSFPSKFRLERTGGRKKR